MNKPVIENADRGITLNKSLAWTMVCAIIGAGIFVGVEIAGSRNAQESSLKAQSEIIKSLEDLKAQQRAQRDSEVAARGALDSRLRVVETTTASDRSEIAGLRRDLTEFRSELREVLQILRHIK